MKRLILVMLLAAVLAPLASAGTIDVLFAGGTWSWAGGAGSVLHANSTTVLANGSFVALPIAISSGPALGGNGHFPTPYTWGAGGSITVGGCGGACFSGTFLSSQLGLNGFGGMTFVGDAVLGNVNPVFLALLGLNPGVTTYTGLIHLDVSPAPVSFALGSGRNADGRVKVGTLGSGDLHISTVPEPGSLALFGSGIIGLAGMLRRRLNR